MKKCRAIIADNEVVLANEVAVALTGWERLRGLLGRDELPAGEGLLIPSCRSVHSCFMRFPIDVVYLSGAGSVVKIVEKMAPWRLSACLGADAVLELPAGWAQKMGLRVRHILAFADLPPEPA